jgi:hypothetical protein
MVCWYIMPAAFPSRPLVPLTPDQSIMWNQHTIGSLDSTLYVSPELRPEDPIINDLVGVARHGFNAISRAEFVGRGTRGEVCRLGNYAIKRAHSPALPDYQVGLPALRATVTLSEGLRRLDAQTVKNSGPCYSTPMPLASLVNLDLNGTTCSTILMPYVEGEQPGKFQLNVPTAWTRKRRYRAAVRLCGADPADIEYDDSRLNLRITYDHQGRVDQLFKLDVNARSDLGVSI